MTAEPLTRPASLEVRGERFVRGVAFGSESVPRSLGVGHFGVPLLLVNHGLQILSDGPAFSGRAPAVALSGQSSVPALSGPRSRLSASDGKHMEPARVPRASSSPAEPLTYQPETIFSAVAAAVMVVVVAAAEAAAEAEGLGIV